MPGVRFTGASEIMNRTFSVQQYGNLLYKNMTISSTSHRHAKCMDLIKGVFVLGVRFVRPETSQGVINPCRPLMWFGYPGTNPLAETKSACS